MRGHALEGPATQACPTVNPGRGSCHGEARVQAVRGRACAHEGRAVGRGAPTGHGLAEAERGRLSRFPRALGSSSVQPRPWGASWAGHGSGFSTCQLGASPSSVLFFPCVENTGQTSRTTGPEPTGSGCLCTQPGHVPGRGAPGDVTACGALHLGPGAGSPPCSRAGDHAEQSAMSVVG